MTDAPIAVACPNGHAFRVKPKARGHKVKCPKCSAATAIPTGDSIGRATPAVSPPLDASPVLTRTPALDTSKRRPARKFDTTTLLLAGGLCFFALTTLVLLSVLLFRGNESDAVAAVQPTKESNQEPERKPVSVTASIPEPEPTPLAIEPRTDSNEPETKVEPKPSSTKPQERFLISLAKTMRVESMYVQQIGDVSLLVGVEQSIGYVPLNYSYPTTTGTDIGFEIRFLKS